MRLWAHVHFGGENRGIDAAFLVNAFFQEFNPNSSIMVKGDEATLEVYFDSTPPARIVSAIEHCTSFDLRYGEVPQEFEGKEVILDSPDNSSPTVVEQPSEIEVEPTSISNRPTDQAFSDDSSKELDDPNVSQVFSVPKEFTGFQNRAHSYEEFKDLVIQWLNLKGRYEAVLRKALEFFEASASFKWKAFQKYCEGTEIEISDSIQSGISQELSKRFRNCSYKFTFIPLLKLITQFKEFDFAQNNCKPVQISFDMVEGQDDKSDEHAYVPSIEFEAPADENSKSNLESDDEVELESTPMEQTSLQKFHTIPMTSKLEEALRTLNKMLPIQERIKHILDAMGLNDPDFGEEMRGTILQVANVAMSTNEDEFDSDKVAGPTQRMVFSVFINDFVNKNDKAFPKVHLVDFLKELKEIVL